MSKKKLCKRCRKFLCRCERQAIIRQMLYAEGPANPPKKVLVREQLS